MRCEQFRAVVTVGLLLGLLAPAAPAQDAQLTKIEVSPPDVFLKTVRDRQSLIVQATYSDGLTQDVTDQAKFTLADGTLVRLDKNVLHPAVDGKTEVTVEFAGQKVVVPVEVSEAAAERPISFKLDVMPVFMKTSCNNGSCHGAARGKDGFMLSLFGFDPDGDHFRLTREAPGRRINLASGNRCKLQQIHRLIRYPIQTALNHRFDAICKHTRRQGNFANVFQVARIFC